MSRARPSQPTLVMLGSGLEQALLARATEVKGLARREKDLISFLKQSAALMGVCSLSAKNFGQPESIFLKLSKENLVYD
jgi:hypothetical protein